MSQISGRLIADPEPVSPDGAPSRFARRRADLFFWLLVALAPPIFAAASWNPSGEARPFQALALRYSLPITAIEIAVIAYAISAGFQLADAFRPLPRWAKLALASLGALALCTALLAATPFHSSIRTCQLLVHLLFGFSTAYLFRTRWTHLPLGVWSWITVGTAVYVIAVIAWVLAVQDDPEFNWIRFRLGVVHIRQTGFYSAAGAAAALGLAAIARTRSHYWLAVAGASLLFGLSYWSGTRGSLLAVLAAFMTGLALLPAMRSWRALGALVSSAVVGGLLSLAHQVPHRFYGLMRISESAAATGADEITTGRLGMWEAAARASLDRPLFGYGESQFGIAVPVWGQFNHPHNIFVQILVQWGLVGFVCYFSLAALVAWRFMKIARSGGSDLVPPFLVAAALVTMSLYEGSLYHPYPIMMIVLSAAFVLAVKPSARSAYSPAST